MSAPLFCCETFRVSLMLGWKLEHSHACLRRQIKEVALRAKNAVPQTELPLEDKEKKP